MTKSKSKRKASQSSRSKNTASAKPVSHKTAGKTLAPKPSIRSQVGQPSEASSQPPVRAESKQAVVIAMLRAPGGTTISAMIQATGWQQHSVRRFLAGVVRKKLGLNLTSEAGEQGRIYRVEDGAAAAASSVERSQAA